MRGQGERMSGFQESYGELMEATTEGQAWEGSGDKEPRAKTRKEKFLRAYRTGMSVGNAARAAAVDRRTVYRWRDRDPEFAKAWLEAREGLVEDLEMEAYKRAFKGNDRLLMFLLRSYKPVTYNERRQKDKNNQQQAESEGAKDRDVAELVERVRGCK